MKYKVYNIEDFGELNYFAKHNINIYFIWIILLNIIIISMLIYIFFGKMDVVINGKGVVKTEISPIKIINESTGIVSYSSVQQNKFFLKNELIYSIDNKKLLLNKEHLEKKIKNHTVVLEYLKNPNDINFLKQNTENNTLSEIMLSENIYRMKKQKLEIEISELEKNTYILSELLKIGGAAKMEYLNSSNRLSLLKKDLEILSFSFQFERKGKIESFEKELDNTKLELEQVLLQIKKTNIKSPINGSMEVIKNVNVGETILEGTEIGTIISNNSSFTVELFIKEKDILKIKKGMKIKYRTVGDNKNIKIKLKGRVLKISNDSVDINGNKFFLIIGNIENKNKQSLKLLKKGMSVKGSIISKKQKIILHILELLNLKKEEIS